MPSYVSTISEAMERLRCRDPTLKKIYLHGNRCTDSELTELVECLLAHPDIVTELYLSYSRLTDETGVKLAHYIAASSTIKYLRLHNNQFGETTYLALAAALRINMSLKYLGLYHNQEVNKTRIDTAFVDALILNPNRPVKSKWWLYSWGQNEFQRLKRTAEELGHPTMQASLAITIRIVF